APNGIQFVATKSIRPPPKCPTIPTLYIINAIVAVRTACNTNKYGAINRKVNSNGSVIPATTAVNVAGINNAATFFLFSCGVVKYIANAIPIELNIFAFPCNMKPYGNCSFNDFELFANSLTCSNQYAFKPWFITTGPISIGVQMK